MGMRYEDCKDCGGKGYHVEPGTTLHAVCQSCDGCGELPAEYVETPLSASVRTEVPVYNVKQCPDCKGDGCGRCGHSGAICIPADDGRLIRAATDVARAQRAKGIAKYKSTLEDQNGYTVGGMIDMVAEELADGSVYVQKVREMYLALLDEIEQAIDEKDPINCVLRIVKRERGNV